MVDVHVEAHADGIGSHQIVDLPGLVHRHLRVTGARRESAKHHRSTPSPPSQALRQLVDGRGREGDDRRAGRQGAQRRLTRITKLREALSAVDAHTRQEFADQRCHRRSPEKPRLDPTPRPQQPVCKDMTTLAVCGELNLVDDNKVDRAIHRHRLGRAHPVARSRRHPLLLASEQRDRFFADLRAHAIVDFAGEQAQRQADHAALVLQHPFDRTVRFARVGRSKEGADRAAGSVVAHPTGMIRRPPPECKLRLASSGAPQLGASPIESLTRCRQSSPRPRGQRRDRRCVQSPRAVKRSA